MGSGHFLLLTFALGCATARPAQAQVLRGTVTDSAGAPIPDASVALVDSTGRVVESGYASRNGAFRLRAVRAGSYAVFGRRLGFAPKRSEFHDVGVSDTVSITIALTVNPPSLAAVVIRAQRDTIRRSHIFGLDLRTLGGTIITPAEIDRSIAGARDINEVFQRQAIVAFRYEEDRHCIVSNRGYPSACIPGVVDGLLVMDGTSLRDIVPPEVIDYMIVLRGHEVGVLYGSVAENGILLIFTKRGLQRGPR